MVIFVFFSIQKISDFLGINSKTSYAYFLWASLLMILFIMLPIDGSVLTTLKIERKLSELPDVSTISANQNRDN